MNSVTKISYESLAINSDFKIYKHQILESTFENKDIARI